MTEFIYPRDFFANASESEEAALCFVLMPFHERYLQVYVEAIKPTIEQAGMRCIRVDELYSTSPILVDIMDHITKATVVIADLTDRNPNVFYELGLTHVAKQNRAVILVAESSEDIPFDLRHLRVILYERSGDGIARLRSDLAQTLRTLGLAGEQEPGRQAQGAGTFVISVDSVSASLNSDVEVTLWADAPPDGLGYYNIDIRYDMQLLSAVSCESLTAENGSMGVCNPAFDVRTVKFVGALTEGLVGRVAIGTAHFRTGSRTGVAELRPVVHELGAPTLPPRPAEQVQVTSGFIRVQST